MGNVKIIAMLRVKNEARWLAEVLASIQPLTREILILDDHSTDDSVDIGRRMGAEVFPSPFQVDAFDEARDKNYLLKLVRTCEPDYVLAIDGDEILEAGAAEKILRVLSPRTALYCFPIKYVWNDRQHYRFDGVYGRQNQWRMFSLIDQRPDLVYKPTAHPGNLHCGNAPYGLIGAGAMVPVDILHLGYMEAEDRVRKFRAYTERDPHAPGEDGYRHMIIGDLLPPETKTVHGGPLKVFTLAAHKWPTALAATAK
jgi:glycosyltransferase involved in cell wall biosynthesis